MNRPSDLPDFASPPLVEVAIAAYFNGIEALTLNHQILFWQRQQASYPRFSVQQPVMVIEEDITLQPGPSLIPSASIQKYLTGAVPRLWLESDESFLLQVQNNMFSSNWRLEEQPYPRFELLLDRFVQTFSDFQFFLSEIQLERGPTTMVDVTYVNWIPTSPMQDVLRMAAASQISGRNSDAWPAAQNHSLQYQLRAGTEPVGRLTVEVHSAKRADGDAWTDGTQMSLTARVRARQDSDQMREQFAFCRDAIVQAFADLTTEGARAEWQQR